MLSRTSCNDARRKLRCCQMGRSRVAQIDAENIGKLWEMTVELKESVFISLLDSVEMKLWEPVDTTKHKRDLRWVQDKVSKVEKERDAALA